MNELPTKVNNNSFTTSNGNFELELTLNFELDTQVFVHSQPMPKYSRSYSIPLINMCVFWGKRRVQHRCSLSVTLS